MSKSRDRALMSLPRSISVGRSASALSGTRVSRECGWVSVLGYPSRNSMSPIPVHSPDCTQLHSARALQCQFLQSLNGFGVPQIRAAKRVFFEGLLLGACKGRLRWP